MILLRYINSILQYHLHGSHCLKQVSLNHSSRATFYSGHSVTLPVEALEMRNIFYPFPWQRRNGTPKQLCELMRYLLTETCVTLLIDFLKCAKNCDKIDLILNCIFTIFPIIISVYNFTLYVKFPLEQVTNSQKEGRGIAIFFL